MKVVAFLPIKLNSQRLPHKNILPIADKPLCSYLSSTLTKVEQIDEVYIFCSDSTVMNYVNSKVNFLKRDAFYDGNEIKNFELLDNFISRIDADIYVFANTTSPFLKKETIENSLKYVMEKGYDSALTVQKVQTFARYKGKAINYDVNDIPKTQDIEPIFIETSGFYIFKKEIFTVHRRRVGFQPYLQVVDGMEALDIDTKEDYEFANLYAKLEGMKC